MSNPIEIDITIKMGETCENTMSLAEARMLYETLGEMFSGSGSVKRTVAKVEPAPAKEEMQEGMMKIADQKDFVPMPPPNLKVEAAKARAANRTRGCGQR